jgi:hypothetical protein
VVRFFDRITGKYTCECGAKYRIRSIWTPVLDSDDARCDVCDTIMDSWRNAMSFLSFERVKAPIQTQPARSRSFTSSWAKSRTTTLGKKGDVGAS